MNKMILAAGLSLTAFPLAAADSAITASRAVAVAEADTGARALDVERDRTRDGRLVHEVDLARGNRLTTLHIDAETGSIISRASPRLQGYWARFADREELREIARARPMGAMLAALEQRSGGTVFDASFDVERGQPRYEVELATAAGVADIHLDARTGERIALVSDD